MDLVAFFFFLILDMKFLEWFFHSWGETQCEVVEKHGSRHQWGLDLQLGSLHQVGFVDGWSEWQCLTTWRGISLSRENPEVGSLEEYVGLGDLDSSACHTHARNLCSQFRAADRVPAVPEAFAEAGGGTWERGNKVHVLGDLFSQISSLVHSALLQNTQCKCMV